MSQNKSVEEVVDEMPKMVCLQCRGDGYDVIAGYNTGEPEQIQCHACHAEMYYTTLDCVRTLLQQERQTSQERERERCVGIVKNFHTDSKDEYADEIVEEIIEDLQNPDVHPIDDDGRYITLTNPNKDQKDMREPQPPTRSRLWHGAYTQVELKIFEREWKEYLKEKELWYKLQKHLLSTSQE